MRTKRTDDAGGAGRGWSRTTCARTSEEKRALGGLAETHPVLSRNHLMYGPGSPPSALKHCRTSGESHG